MAQRNRFPHGPLMAALAEDLSDHPRSSRELTWMRRPERPQQDDDTDTQECVPQDA